MNKIHYKMFNCGGDKTDNINEAFVIINYDDEIFDEYQPLFRYRDISDKIITTPEIWIWNEDIEKYAKLNSHVVDILKQVICRE